MIAFDAASAHHGARQDSMGQMSGLKISHDPLHRNAAQVPAGQRFSTNGRARARRFGRGAPRNLPIGISVVLDAGEAAHNPYRDESPRRRRGRARLAGVDERAQAQLDLDVLPRAVGQFYARHELQLQSHVTPRVNVVYFPRPSAFIATRLARGWRRTHQRPRLGLAQRGNCRSARWRGDGARRRVDELLRGCVERGAVVLVERRRLIVAAQLC